MTDSTSGKTPSPPPSPPTDWDILTDPEIWAELVKRYQAALDQHVSELLVGDDTGQPIGIVTAATIQPETKPISFAGIHAMYGKISRPWTLACSPEVAATLSNRDDGVPPNVRVIRSDHLPDDAAYLISPEVDVPIDHEYLSTACLHGRHSYCAAAERPDGTPKVPGSCKFCQAACVCECHS
jgi:hypothetical protein